MTAVPPSAVDTWRLDQAPDCWRVPTASFSPGHEVESIEDDGVGAAAAARCWSRPSSAAILAASWERLFPELSRIFERAVPWSAPSVRRPLRMYTNTRP